jgi:hypothetical protein
MEGVYRCMSKTERPDGRFDVVLKRDDATPGEPVEFVASGDFAGVFKPDLRYAVTVVELP